MGKRFFFCFPRNRRLLEWDLIAGRWLCLGVNGGRWTYLECFSMLNIVLTFSHFTCLRGHYRTHACSMLHRKSRPHRRHLVHSINWRARVRALGRRTSLARPFAFSDVYVCSLIGAIYLRTRDVEDWCDWGAGAGLGRAGRVFIAHFRFFPFYSINWWCN